MELPIFRTVRDAYAFAWSRKSDVCLLALPAIVLQWLLNFVTGQTAHLLNGGLLALIIGTVLSLAIATLFAVACYRLCLVEGEPVDVRGAYRWTSRHVRFLLLALLVSAILLTAFWLGMKIIGWTGLGQHRSYGLRMTSPGSFSFPQLFLLGVQLVVLMFVGFLYGRLSILFPAASIDDDARPMDVWRLSSGWGWNLLWIMVLTMVPIWFVSSIAAVAFYSVLDPRSLTAEILAAVISVVTGYTLVALTVFASAIAYRKLRAHDAEAAPKK